MPVYINDQFTDNEKATLHVSDLSIQRGFAVFDFCRTVNGVPLFLNDHLERFLHSAHAMRLQVPYTKPQLIDIIRELVQRSGIADAGIRIMLTGGYSADSYHPAKPNLVITCNAVRSTTQADFDKGLSAITYEYQRELAHIKSINYLMAVWLQPMLRVQQADDVIYFNKQSITEFPRSNVFIVTAAGKLITPAHNILQGITRKKILSLADGIIEVEERDISVEELQQASEIFTTSTTKKVLPVVKLNGKAVNDGRPGNISKRLYEEFLALEQTSIQL
ncbi:MAG TPA: aminotransferase class IV [Panacibacter sp.]|nr:aminotransferase class IV [Panacibacter sp.]HNP44491.1 aminotransferase class IV [Panacibacter sp.]